jgi:hypothetical protein
MTLPRRLASLLRALCLLTPLPAAAAAPAPPPPIAALLRAYPEQIVAFDGAALVMRDGQRLPVSDGQPDKTPAQMLRAGSILDQMRLPYPPGPLAGPPLDDPGRVRNRALFDAMYGDCTRGEVTPRMVPVLWLPHSYGRNVMITSVNGVNRHLAAVSRDLDALPPALLHDLYPLGGTYNCRPVADTGVRSMHAYGAAIDINVSVSDYWLWRHDAPYRNRIPQEIVDIFERHGFIWGGKWAHYDTMHFEYRPELLGMAGDDSDLGETRASVP